MSFDINNPEHRSEIVSIIKDNYGIDISIKYIDNQFIIENKSNAQLPDFNDLMPQIEQRIYERRLNSLRNTRNKLLAETDWWCVQDRTPTPEQLAYRQALRDLTNNFDPYKMPDLPTKPI